MDAKIAKAHHRDPYLHELAITVYGHDNSQIELTHRLMTIMYNNPKSREIETKHLIIYRLILIIYQMSFTFRFKNR